MSTQSNPTITEVHRYLRDDNGWTEEELSQLDGYFFRAINEDGSTTMTFQQWEIAVMAYCDEHFGPFTV